MGGCGAYNPQRVSKENVGCKQTTSIPHYHWRILNPDFDAAEIHFKL